VHRHDSLGTQRARNLRRKDTLPERIVWRWLRDRRFGGWKFRRQDPIGPFIADFYCDPLRLIVEIDGTGHQFTAESDKMRTSYLRRLDIDVVRITNTQVLRDPDSAGQIIIAAIVSRLPSPAASRHPLPRERADYRLATTAIEISSSGGIPAANAFHSSTNVLTRKAGEPFGFQPMIASTNASPNSRPLRLRASVKPSE